MKHPPKRLDPRGLLHGEEKSPPGSGDAPLERSDVGTHRHPRIPESSGQKRLGSSQGTTEPLRCLCLCLAFAALSDIVHALMIPSGSRAAHVGTLLVLFGPCRLLFPATCVALLKFSYLNLPLPPLCLSSECWSSSPPTGQRNRICQNCGADGAVTQPTSLLGASAHPSLTPSRMASTACWENWGASGLRIHNGLENSGEWLLNNMGRCANLSTPPKARDPPLLFPRPFLPQQNIRP